MQDIRKSEVEIVVVDREKLFSDKFFEGFLPEKEFDYEKIILENYFFKKRGLVENDKSLKQPIGYSVVVNPFSKKIFVYRRASDEKKYGEKRLMGNWSWGAGGHIEKTDCANGKNPIISSIIREIKEEVKIDGNFELKKFGYVNHEFDVHAVHFGIVYLVIVNTDYVKPNDSESSYGRMMSIEEIEEIINSQDAKIDQWSITVFDWLKKFLEKVDEEK